MKPALIAFLILIFLFVYLNRTYSYFYSYLDSHKLINPNTKTIYDLNESKNAIPYKYVALGDSLTAGVGSNNYTQTFPYLLAKDLSRKYESVELINLGQPGYETKDLLVIEIPKAINEQPDLITILTGINDIHNLVSLDEFTSNYQRILDEVITKTKSQILIINIPYLGFSKTVFFPYPYLLDLRTRKFNEAIKKIATNKKIKHIDLYSKTKQEALTSKSYYSEDLFHPSKEGYILWEKIISAN